MLDLNGTEIVEFVDTQAQAERLPEVCPGGGIWIVRLRFGNRGAGKDTQFCEMAKRWREAEDGLVVAVVKRHEGIVAVTYSGIMEASAGVVSPVGLAGAAMGKVSLAWTSYSAVGRLR